MDTVTLRYGVDVLEGLRALPANSVHCVVTSPPYWGLRDYGTGAAQLGMEPVPDCLGWATGAPCGACYVCHLVAVFAEIRRVLRTDGTVWLNLGDSYSSSGGAHGGRSDNQCGVGARIVHENGNGDQAPRQAPPDLKAKNQCMIPARVALALQAAGWYVRQDIIWHKTAPMPESVQDRFTKAHEYVFLLAKSPRYFFDAAAVREDNAGIMPYGDKIDFKMNDDAGQGRHGASSMFAGGSKEDYVAKYYTNGRNRRDVWTLGPDPYPGAHFACMPRELARLCILAGTSAAGCCEKCGAPWVRVEETRRENYKAIAYATVASGGALSGGIGKIFPDTTRQHLGWRPTCTCNAGAPVPCTVLDPFSGSGTTAATAKQCGRAAIGIDLNAAYLALAEDRIAAVTAPLVPAGYEDPAPLATNGNGAHEQTELFAW